MSDTANPIVETDLTALTAQIVAGMNVSAGEVASAIATVYASLAATRAPETAEPEPVELKPAVPIKKSVHSDRIVCLEDGLSFKSLKRHLRTKYGMTPDEYRTKWGLPSDYPMVAPEYAEKRSALAKSMGLGAGRRKTKTETTTETTDAETVAA